MLDANSSVSVALPDAQRPSMPTRRGAVASFTLQDLDKLASRSARFIYLQVIDLQVIVARFTRMSRDVASELIAALADGAVVATVCDWLGRCLGIELANYFAGVAGGDNV